MQLQGARYQCDFPSTALLTQRGRWPNQMSTGDGLRVDEVSTTWLRLSSQGPQGWGCRHRYEIVVRDENHMVEIIVRWFIRLRLSSQVSNCRQEWDCRHSEETVWSRERDKTGTKLSQGWDCRNKDRTGAQEGGRRYWQEIVFAERRLGHKAETVVTKWNRCTGTGLPWQGWNCRRRKEFHRSICLEFSVCQSATSPHSVWVQKPAQDFLFRQAVFKT